MKRREFLIANAALLAQQAWPRDAHAAERPDRAIPFGAAVRGDALVDDYAYRMALVGNCNLVVPEGGLKWIVVRPAPGEFDFFDADRLLTFADKNNMKMRGHTLVWYAAMPEWTNAIKGSAEASRELDLHIDTLVTRYKGRIPSWDVVNEAIADEPTETDFLRPNLWRDTIGKNYVETAFRRAASADPQAQLVLNEYDIEFVGEPYKARRAALLRLVRDLKDRDAPIHAVGLQGHLKGGLEIDKEGVSAFVQELKTMGIDVLVTELDVIDHELASDVDERDLQIAGRVSDFLGAIFAANSPKAILTWGISDRYTWVPMYFKRDDGTLNRPLPLDHAYQPKPFMRIIDEFTKKTG